MAEEIKFCSLVPLFEVAEDSTLRGNPAGIIALNVNFYAQAEGGLDGLVRMDSPGILQSSRGASEFQGGPLYITEMITNAMRERKVRVPICNHLDHGNEDVCQVCINSGYSSVMIDKSTTKDKKKTSLEDNIRATKSIVELAHPRGISVEGELGVLAGQEEDVIAKMSIYPTAEEVIEYAIQSQADAIAIASGTCHGAIKKFKRLERELLHECYELLKKHNLRARPVMHGSSTVPKDLVRELAGYGVNLGEASGIPIEAIKDAISYGGIRKINIDTDLRMGITAEVLSFLRNYPDFVRTSENLCLIKEVFDRTFQDEKDGKSVDWIKIIDPRTYFKPIMQKDPKLLRRDYRESGDDVYINLMGRISRRISAHVQYLVGEFGSVGLAEKVAA